MIVFKNLIKFFSFGSLKKLPISTACYLHSEDFTKINKKFIFFSNICETFDLRVVGKYIVYI